MLGIWSPVTILRDRRLFFVRKQKQTMKTIYIVIHWTDDNEIEGVFSDNEAAYEFMSQQRYPEEYTMVTRTLNEYAI